MMLDDPSSDPFIYPSPSLAPGGCDLSAGNASQVLFVSVASLVRRHALHSRS